MEAALSSPNAPPRSRDRSRIRRKPQSASANWGTRAFLVVALGVLTASGCTFDTPMPRQRELREPATAPRHLRFAIVGVPTDGELDCAANDCNHWYRVDAIEPGPLTVAVARRAGGDGSTIRILIRELGQRVLARRAAGPDEALSLSVDVVPGVYAILVQTGMGKVPYTLTVTMKTEGDGDVPGPDHVP